MNSAVRRNFKA